MQEKSPTLQKTTIHEAFGTMYDPRQAGKVVHPLINILFIALCATVCGAEDWVQIAAFGRSQKEWLSQFLTIGKDTPSHDTFGTVFGMLHCEDFSDHFQAWVRLLQVQFGNHVAIDGKLVHGSKDAAIGRDAIDVVSAFATKTGLTLAQWKVGEKTNEITAIPHLLEMLDLAGCVVTIDAMGCHRHIVEQICEAQGDAIIALKGNQGNLHADTREMFAYFEKIDFADIAHSYSESVNSGHGRIEVRQAWAFDPTPYAPHFRTLDKWPHLKTLIMRRTRRIVGDKVTEQTRYFLSTLSTPVVAQIAYVRDHWQIENSLHWVLDVAFSEDNQQVRKQHAAANCVALRHMALNLLRLDSSPGSIPVKRMKCAWDADFRMRVLAPLLQL